jgi:hypothetical protein
VLAVVTERRDASKKLFARAVAHYSQSFGDSAFDALPFDAI